MVKHLTEEERVLVESLIELNTPITHIAKALEINYKTAKRILELQFNNYKGNQSGRGFSKVKKDAPTLEDYFSNKIYISSYKLKLKLFQSGLKSEVCEVCGLTSWLNRPIPLELHHIDGNPYDNCLTNLQIVCPNCHALSENYRTKKTKL
jgi:H-N-H endonuclease F-tflIV